MFIGELKAGPKRIAAGGGPAELLPTAHLLNSTSDWKSSKNQAVNPLLLPAGKPHAWALSKKKNTKPKKPTPKLITLVPKHHLWKALSLSTSAPKSSCHCWKGRFKAPKMHYCFQRHSPPDLLQAGQPRRACLVCTASQHSTASITLGSCHRHTWAPFSTAQRSPQYGQQEVGTGKPTWYLVCWFRFPPPPQKYFFFPAFQKAVPPLLKWEKDSYSSCKLLIKPIYHHHNSQHLHGTFHP